MVEAIVAYKASEEVEEDKRDEVQITNPVSQIKGGSPSSFSFESYFPKLSAAMDQFDSILGLTEFGGDSAKHRKLKGPLEMIPLEE